MRKKISLLLVAALCCSTILAGCSKSESTGTQGSSAQQEVRKALWVSAWVPGTGF